MILIDVIVNKSFLLFSNVLSSESIWWISFDSAFRRLHVIYVLSRDSPYHLWFWTHSRSKRKRIIYDVATQTNYEFRFHSSPQSHVEAFRELPITYRRSYCNTYALRKHIVFVFHVCTSHVHKIIVLIYKGG